MINKDYEEYKKLVQFFTELRDTAKRISDISNHSIQILNNPYELINNGPEKLDRNVAEIQLNFLTLNSFITSLNDDKKII